MADVKMNGGGDYTNLQADIAVDDRSMLDINYPSQVLQLLHVIKGRNSFIFKVSIKLVNFFSRL